MLKVEHKGISHQCVVPNTTSRDLNFGPNY